MKNTKKIVVLASGEGSTFRAIAKAIEANQLNAELVGLVVSRDAIGALDHAEELGVPTKVISPKNFTDRELWDIALTETVRRQNPDWIVLAGYTQLLGPQFLKQFRGRVLNTHPSLLPKFGGQGMYGLKVHQAVIAAGEKVSGVTVHLVTDHYDEGPIVKQMQVPVQANDTAESLALRIKNIEKQFYIATLKELFEK